MGEGAGGGEVDEICGVGGRVVGEGEGGGEADD